MKPCAECGGIPYKVAIWFVGLSGYSSCAHLCKDCHARFKEKGVSGIPKAHAQSRSEAAADWNKKRRAGLA